MRHSVRQLKTGAAAALAVVLVSACGSGPKRLPAIGEAYIGPATAQLRNDTTPQSPVVATVKHGERVDILLQKRKVLRVRTANGVEGWTDERQLLAAADMQALRELSTRAARMPSQGQAAAYADIRVRTQPSVQAPSYMIIKGGEKFEVLADATLPRTEVPRTPLVPPAPKKPKTERKATGKNAKLPPPPAPRPPGPPADWLELSKSPLAAEAPPPEEPHTEKATPSDRWSLIRTAGGQAGWVYSRAISMAIPDDVAQYAEGHRIVSYFSLGAVQNGAESKPTWLWTTVASGPQPYDFDCFRVFVWSPRKHRYETAHVELHLKGFSPVLLDSVDLSSTGKTKGERASGRSSAFSVCIQKKDGQRARREYALINGTTVRFIEERPCEPPAPPIAIRAATPLPGAGVGSADEPKESFWGRVKRRWHALTGH